MELSEFLQKSIEQIEKGIRAISPFISIPTVVHFKISVCFSDDPDVILVCHDGDTNMEFDVKLPW